MYVAPSTLCLPFISAKRESVLPWFCTLSTPLSRAKRACLFIIGGGGGDRNHQSKCIPSSSILFAFTPIHQNGRPCISNYCRYIRRRKIGRISRLHTKSPRKKKIHIMYVCVSGQNKNRQKERLGWGQNKGRRQKKQNQNPKRTRSRVCYERTTPSP